MKEFDTRGIDGKGQGKSKLQCRSLPGPFIALRSSKMNSIPSSQLGLGASDRGFKASLTMDI